MRTASVTERAQGRVVFVKPKKKKIPSFFTGTSIEGTLAILSMVNMALAGLVLFLHSLCFAKIY